MSPNYVPQFFRGPIHNDQFSFHCPLQGNAYILSATGHIATCGPFDCNVLKYKSSFRMGAWEEVIPFLKSSIPRAYRGGGEERMFPPNFLAYFELQITK